jgi:prepilin-type N-terminal cleavage/methylation domain-containing protein
MIREKRRTSGFTIVELLVVIAVIGILATISIVSYQGVREKSRIAAGLAFEQQLISKYSGYTTGDWSFDECSGTTTGNRAVAPSTDTIIGTATWITDTPSGRGCALRFNGATRIETQASLGATSYVKAAWIRIAPAGPCGNILSKAAMNGADAPFWTTSCKLTAGYQANYTAVQAPTTINDNLWHYVAAIWENSTLALYIDGKSVATTTGAPAPSPTGGLVSIGSHAGANYFTGDIDNPFISTQ